MSQGASNLPSRHGVILVLLAGVCWSTMGIGVRLMEVANVWQILFFRSLALAPFLLIVITIRSGGKPLSVVRKSGWAGVIGGLGLVFAFTGGIYAFQKTTIANAAFLFASAPFFAAMLGLFLLRESVRRATWIAMLVALVGICIMVWEGIAVGHLIGNAAALVSAMGFAVFTIALRWGKLEEMMPTVLLAGIFALVTSATVCFFSGYTLFIPLNDILIALAMGIFQVGAGLILYTIGSKTVPAAELALLSMTEVVLAPLIVWVFLGETAGFFILLGGAVLLTAISVNALSGLRKKPTPIL
jgi:drug/metabolite transporter, DME family